MIEYKIDVLDALEKAGYSCYELRRQKLIGQSSIQKMRSGKMVGVNVLDNVCALLNLQPGEIIEYTEVSHESEE